MRGGTTLGVLHKHLWRCLPSRRTMSINHLRAHTLSMEVTTACLPSRRTMSINHLRTHTLSQHPRAGLNPAWVSLQMLLDTFGEVFICSWRILVRYIRTLSVIFSSYIAVHIMVLHCGVCKVIWLADYVGR